MVRGEVGEEGPTLEISRGPFSIGVDISHDEKPKEASWMERRTRDGMSDRWKEGSIISGEPSWRFR